MAISRRTFLQSLAGFYALPFAFSWAGKLEQPLSASGLNIAFAIMLGDDKVGTHSISIHKNGSDTEIKHAIDITVTIAFVNVYSLKHRSTEMWRGADSHSVRLLSLESDTMEDGKHKQVKGQATADTFVVKTATGQVSLPLDIATTNSFWVDVTTLRPHLIDSTDGTLIASHVETLPDDTIDGKAAEHVRLQAGKQSAEAWFIDEIMVRGQTVRKDHVVTLLPLRESK